MSLLLPSLLAFALALDDDDAADDEDDEAAARLCTTELALVRLRHLFTTFTTSSSVEEVVVELCKALTVSSCFLTFFSGTSLSSLTESGLGSTPSSITGFLDPVLTIFA